MKHVSDVFSVKSLKTVSLNHKNGLARMFDRIRTLDLQMTRMILFMTGCFTSFFALNLQLFIIFCDLQPFFEWLNILIVIVSADEITSIFRPVFNLGKPCLVIILWSESYFEFSFTIVNYKGIIYFSTSSLIGWKGVYSMWGFNSI